MPLLSRWEHHFIHWAEQQGYTMDYAANLDLEQRPAILEDYSLVLSVGHDEYWSAGMRDSLEAWIARGGNCAFFSGNSVCWRVRPEDDGKALTCFKQLFQASSIPNLHSALLTERVVVVRSWIPCGTKARRLS